MMGTGAFDVMRAQRGALVNVVGDHKAFLSLIPQSDYVQKRDGAIEIQMNDRNDDVDGLGVNPNAVTYVKSLFTIQNNGTQGVEVRLQTGLYRRYLVEHRYLAVIPTSTIDALYRIHPWAPIVAIDVLLGVPFYLLSIALVGRGRVRTRSRDGPSALDRLRSRLG